MRDNEYLDLSIIPNYNLCAFRFFLPHESHIMRTSSDDVLLLMLDGILRFEEDDRTVDLRKGEWYIQHAGGYQTGLRESDSPNYFYIHFFASYTQSRHNSLSCMGHFDTQRLMPLLTGLDQCTDYAHGRLDHQINFLRILTCLSDCEKNVMPNSSLCMEVAEYIDQHYTESISLADLGQRFSYSRDHIIRVFKQFYGITPYQYLTLQRVSRAKMLLKSTNHLISDVSRECGYNDVTSFFRAFTRQTGKNPSQYQEAINGTCRSKSRQRERP